MARRKAFSLAWNRTTLQDNAYLMHHKDVGLIDATGGPGVVKAAYSSGKPALGVGPGNTPVYLEKTADLNMAVVDIITSKTFDNGTICASEQTVVIDDEIYDLVLQEICGPGRAHLQRERDGAAGAHGDRSRNRIHAAHGRRPESHRHRPHDRSTGQAEHQTADCADSRRGSRTSAVGREAVSRCSRSTGRNPSMRRSRCAWT